MSEKQLKLQEWKERNFRKACHKVGFDLSGKTWKKQERSTRGTDYILNTNITPVSRQQNRTYDLTMAAQETEGVRAAHDTMAQVWPQVPTNIWQSALDTQKWMAQPLRQSSQQLSLTAVSPKDPAGWPSPVTLAKPSLSVPDVCGRQRPIQTLSMLGYWLLEFLKWILRNRWRQREH